LTVLFWQSPLKQNRYGQAAFAMLVIMLDLFYILVVLQIALGAYSLWDGLEWFRMVRRRLGTHAGFYAPVAAVICP